MQPSPQAEPLVAAGAPWWSAMALVLAVGAATLLVGLLLFDHHSPVLDSEVYERQARELVEGRLAVPEAMVAADGAPPFFAYPEPRGEPSWVWRYHPSVALLVASGLVVGAGRWWLPVLSSAGFVVAVLALARSSGLSRPVALVAGSVAGGAPLLLLSGANIQANVPAAALLLGATASLLGSAGRPRRQVLAGFLWGAGFAVRPFEAIAFLVVLCVVARRERAQPWPALLGAMPPLALTAALNLAVTGAPWRYPFWIGNPHDRFGLGWRAVGATELSYYGPLEAVRGAAGAALFLLVMVPAGAVVAVAALRSLRQHWPGSGLLLALGLLPFAFYLVHWSGIAWAWNGLQHRLGPLYHLSALGPLAVLAAPVLHDWWRRRRPQLVVALVLALLLPAPWWVHVVRTNVADRSQRIALHQDLAALPDGGLVVIDAASTTVPYARLPGHLRYRYTGGRPLAESLEGLDRPWVVLDPGAVGSSDPHLRGGLVRLRAIDAPVSLEGADGGGLTVGGAPCDPCVVTTSPEPASAIVEGATTGPLVVVRGADEVWVEDHPALLVDGGRGPVTVNP
jgi:hypothetical protein